MLSLRKAPLEGFAVSPVPDSLPRRFLFWRLRLSPLRPPNSNVISRGDV